MKISQKERTVSDGEVIVLAGVILAVVWFALG